MVRRVFAKYNFISNKSGKIYSYVDIENAVSLRIIESGWKGKYDCVLEWGEYERVDVNVYTGEEIKHYYGINTFSRREKLKQLSKIKS
jgi:hypothetical protein